MTKLHGDNHLVTCSNSLCSNDLVTRNNYLIKYSNHQITCRNDLVTHSNYLITHSHYLINCT